MDRVNKILYWLPRIFGILITVFISIFALDVFGSGYGFWDTIIALLIHLVPTYILVAFLVVAWKYEQIGGLFYIGFSMFYCIMVAGKAPSLWYFIVAGPVFLIGILFLAHSYTSGRYDKRN